MDGINPLTLYLLPIYYYLFYYDIQFFYYPAFSTILVFLLIQILFQLNDDQLKLYLSVLPVGFYLSQGKWTEVIVAGHPLQEARDPL